MADQARNSAAAATSSAAATSRRASGITLSDLSNLTCDGEKLADRGEYPKAYHQLRVRKGLLPATAVEFVDDFCRWYRRNNMMGNLPYKTTAVGFAKSYFGIVKMAVKDGQLFTDLPAANARVYGAAAGRQYNQY